MKNFCLFSAFEQQDLWWKTVGNVCKYCMSIMIVNNDCEKRKQQYSNVTSSVNMGGCLLFSKRSAVAETRPLVLTSAAERFNQLWNSLAPELDVQAMFLKRRLSKLPQTSNLEALSRHPQTWMDVE
jgi:hypothetical protein